MLDLNTSAGVLYGRVQMNFSKKEYYNKSQKSLCYFHSKVSSSLSLTLYGTYHKYICGVNVAHELEKETSTSLKICHGQLYI